MYDLIHVWRGTLNHYLSKLSKLYFVTVHFIIVIIILNYATKMFSFTTNVYLFQISVIGIPIQNTPPTLPPQDSRGVDLQ